jgi:hypothetical protein
MSITAPIPMPKYGADAFMEGASTAQGIFESMAKARQANQQTSQNQALFPYTKALTAAQTQEAQGQAARANAWAALAQKYGHLGAPTVQPTSSPQDQNAALGQMAPTVSEPGDSATVTPNMANAAPNPLIRPSAMQAANNMPSPSNAPSPSSQSSSGNDEDYPSPVVAGLLKMPLQSPQAAAQMQRQTARANAFASEDAKTAHEYDEEGAGAEKTLFDLDQMQQVFKNPLWAGMRQAAKLPFGDAGRKEMGWYMHQGSPEEQKLAGTFMLAANNMIADTASKFKGGRFTQNVLKLAGDMKISENDTAPTAEAKAQLLRKMAQFSQDRSSLISNAIRKGSTPADAIDMADKQMKTALMTKTAQGQLEDINKSESKNNKPSFQQPDKIGKEHVTEENIRATLTAHPELTQEQLMKSLKDRGLI